MQVRTDVTYIIIVNFRLQLASFQSWKWLGSRTYWADFILDHVRKDDPSYHDSSKKEEGTEPN